MMYQFFMTIKPSFRMHLPLYPPYTPTIEWSAGICIFYAVKLLLPLWNISWFPDALMKVILNVLLELVPGSHSISVIYEFYISSILVSFSWLWFPSKKGDSMPFSKTSLMAVIAWPFSPLVWTSFNLSGFERLSFWRSSLVGHLNSSAPTWFGYPKKGKS